jgi:hypothetical protein
MKVSMVDIDWIGVANMGMLVLFVKPFYEVYFG